MSDKKQKKADIVAVAIAASVSPATVSRFFNRPELVRLSTRRKIDRTVKKLGYIRNRAAQTIHGIRSGTIGLVVPTIDNTIFAEMIQAFSDEVGLNGFTILLGTHNYNNAREYDVLRKFLEHRVDGVAVVGLWLPSSPRLSHRARRGNIPLHPSQVAALASRAVWMDEV